MPPSQRCRGSLAVSIPHGAWSQILIRHGRRGPNIMKCYWGDPSEFSQPVQLL